MITSVHIVEQFSKMKMTKNLNYHQEVLLEVQQEVALPAVHHEAVLPVVHQGAALPVVHQEVAHLRGQLDRRLHPPNQVVHQEGLPEVRQEVLVVVHLPAVHHEAVLQRAQNVALQNE